MSTRTLICLLILCSFSARLAAEEVLARRLSVTFHDTPIKQALDEVARRADFEWSYNTSILNPNKKVSLTASDWTVREILREMLGEEYQFKSSGHYLILKKEKPPKTAVSGIIRATQSGPRLANVTVYDRKTLRATTTDSSGFYELKVKKKTELVVVRRGYQDTILQVASLTPRYRNLELSPVPLPAADTTGQQINIRASLKKAATELDYFFNARLDQWHDLNVPDTLRRRFQLSFLPLIGTNHVLSRKVENDFSINLLAGQSAGVRYFEAAGLGNFTQKQVQGFQGAGLFNLNRGNCQGVQAAGLYNQTADTLTGAQFAGMLNVAQSSPKFSLQAAGLANVIRKQDTDSLPPKCVQLAGLANKAQSLEGVQAAGLFNTARQIKGVQAAGLINHAQAVNGAQVSGLINRSKRLRGVQIGVFNHTDNLHGVQIGLLNRSGKRWMPLVNWGK